MRSIARGVGLLLVIAGVMVAVPLAPLQAQPSSSGIGALAWLAGSWAGSDGRNDHEEHWTAPKGGAMVGVHRTVRDGRMVEFEFLRIEEQNGALVYLSMPNGRSPATPFTLKSIEGRARGLRESDARLPPARRLLEGRRRSPRADRGHGGREEPLDGVAVDQVVAD